MPAATSTQSRKTEGEKRSTPRRSSRPVGRPSKFSKEVAHAIIAKARIGLPLKFCSQAAGVSKDAVEEWRARWPDFDRELTQAQAEAVADAWTRIEQAGLPFGKRPGDWRSDAWRLEKAYPPDFAKPPEVAVTNNVTTNTALQITIVESREIESRTVVVDAQVDELFNQRRRSIREP
jgi:hypothetical protein